MTTDEMIEVMARAIWEAQCDHWGEYRAHNPELVAWDDLTHSKRNEIKREARAALAAILPVLREDIAAVVMAAPIGGRTRRVRARFDEIAKEVHNAKLS